MAEQNNELHQRCESPRILTRLLAKKMDVDVLFVDPEATRGGEVSYFDLGTTCTDNNGEEDSD